MMRYSSGMVAAAFAVASTAAVHAADVSPISQETFNLLFAGEVGVFGGSSGWDGCGCEPHHVWGGYGKISVPFHGNMSIQLDGNVDVMKGNLSTLAHAVTGGAHLLWRDPQSHQIGLFAGVGQAPVDGGQPSTSFIGGVEGQAYLQNLTLFGQAGYVWGYENGDPTDDPFRAGLLRAGAMVFFDPTFMVEAEATAAFGTFNGSPMTAVLWAAGVRKQLGGTHAPLSIFARYEGGSYTCCAGNLVNNAFKIGIIAAFGAPDPFAQNRYGANTSLPQFAHLMVVDVLE